LHVECSTQGTDKVPYLTTGITGAGATERSSIPTTTTNCSCEETVTCEDHLWEQVVWIWHGAQHGWVALMFPDLLVLLNVYMTDSCVLQVSSGWNVRLEHMYAQCVYTWGFYWELGDRCWSYGVTDQVSS